MKFLPALGKIPQAIGLGVGVVLLGLLAFDNWLPYSLLSHHKYAVMAQPPILDQYGAKAETFTFMTADRVEISGWFIPAKTPTQRTIIILHTLGSNRQDMLEFGLPL